MDGRMFDGLGGAIRGLVIFATIGVAALAVAVPVGVWWLAKHVSVRWNG